jgi:AcrR family transcriptional regulator
MARKLAADVRRAEIIATADSVIAAEGFQSLSLREVARRCGMSAPGLMHYFPDLTTLLEAVLDHRDEVDLAAIVHEIPEGASLDELIENALVYYEQSAETTRRFDALEAEAISPLHPAHAYYLERDARNFARIRPAIEAEFDDPEEAVALIRAVLDGLRFRLLRDPDNVNLRQEWHKVRPAVLGSLARTRK